MNPLVLGLEPEDIAAELAPRLVIEKSVLVFIHHVLDAFVEVANGL